jgi:hypothetical protein
MKRIAGTLIIVSFAGAATAAVAANTPYPSSAQEETPMSTEFPNAPTYKQEHKNDAGAQSRTPAPRAAGSARSATEQSKADEGRVPGTAGVPPADGARGATR